MYYIPVELHGIFCVQFWFKVLGEEAGPLSVVTQNPTAEEPQNAKIIWPGKTNTITSDWRFAATTVDTRLIDASQVRSNNSKNKTNVHVIISSLFFKSEKM